MEETKPRSKDKLAIVLSGGGARASYQLGVLKYIFSELNCIPHAPIFVGNSAGAINAYYLTLNAHKGLNIAIQELCDHWTKLKIDHVYKTDSWSIIKILGNFIYNFFLGRFGFERHVESILDTTPLYLLLRKLYEEDAGYIHQNIQNNTVHALGITAMQYGTGKSITFFDTADPKIKEWDRPRRSGYQTKLRLKHVLASAAIPILFPSVRIEHAYYGDGSVRSMAPLSSAIQLGANKVLVIHLRTKAIEQLKPLESYPSMSQIAGMMLNTAFLDALEFDLAVLSRINDLVSKAGGDYVLRKVLVEVIRPSKDLGLLVLPFRKNISPALAFLLKGLGPTVSSGADLLSYLLFDGKYAEALIQQGFDDAHAYKDEFLKFFSTVALS